MRQHLVAFQMSLGISGANVLWSFGWASNISWLREILVECQHKTQYFVEFRMSIGIRGDDAGHVGENIPITSIPVIGQILEFQMSIGITGDNAGHAGAKISCIFAQHGLFLFAMSITTWAGLVQRCVMLSRSSGIVHCSHGVVAFTGAHFPHSSPWHLLVTMCRF